MTSYECNGCEQGGSGPIEEYLKWSAEHKCPPKGAKLAPETVAPVVVKKPRAPRKTKETK